MKTIIRTLATLIIFLCGTFACSAAKEQRTDTADFIINGLILQKNKKLDQHCSLELFYENTKIDSIRIKCNKPFEYKLKKNVWYTIRVTKEGHVPLLISFNTEINDNETIKDNFFAFETELIDLVKAKSLNKDILDFPVGLVAFNKETRKFEARDIYTQNHIAGLYHTPTENIDIAKEYVTKRDLNNDWC